MRDLERFRSPQEIHAELKLRGQDVGLTTVYRHLNRLAEEGLIDVVRTPDGDAVYRLCGVDSHHHHLTCRNCGRTVEVEAPPQVERWVGRVGKEAAFREVSHTVEIFGICESCGG
jgi:Fur family ferric uptake transcriptional regulator